MQRCGKYICAAVNQHATIEETVFSVVAAPILYNMEPSQIELEYKRLKLDGGQAYDRSKD
jgi:hypothetical protein